MGRMFGMAAMTAFARRNGRSILWWWLTGAFATLFTAHWLGVVPASVDRLLPGIGADSALLAGLLGGLGIAYLVLQRRATNDDAALHDPATGLLRRAPADTAAARLIARDDRDGVSRLALVLLEIEDGDDIVRRYGQRAVDQLLAMVAATLLSQCRGADLPFRFDRRILGVYLDSKELASADAFARRIAVLLSSQQLDWHGDVLKPALTRRIVLQQTGQPLKALQTQALSLR